MLKISRLTREYIRVPVAASEAGVAVNPSADTVVMAFVGASALPGVGDWKTAGWEIDTGAYYARCLVGPGGEVELSVGVYYAWVKITDDPEVPVLRAGLLQVT